MSKRTLFLIFALFIIASTLLVLALYNPNSNPKAPEPAVQTISKNLSSETSLKFGEIASSSAISRFSYSLPINITTNSNKVTTVQLELKYDPNVLRNVYATSGAFFKNPNILLNQIDEEEGRISYALSVNPSSNGGLSGEAVVAILNFETNTTTPLETSIIFLPKTFVTAEGITNSALKETINTKFTIEGRPISTSSAVLSPTSSPTP